MNKLHNKIVIVTGAAHGIGRAIAEEFVRLEGRVVMADLDGEEGERVAKEIGAEFVKCDVSKAEDVRRVVEAAQIMGKGRIDCVVNNAAYIANWHNILEASEEEWDRSYAVTLRGASHFIKGVLPFMKPFKSGSIVNVSSVQGMVGARMSPAYTAMKHALIGLTRNVAYDFGLEGIRCNALCPGAIRVRHSPAEGSEWHLRQVGKTFLGRVGMPMEVAKVAGFLASEESSYVTGAVVAVDGGWTAM
ncbi:MAG TPA: SDR family oxidoreductase [Tepidisphaeraceae bacterium]|jgi:NAD(P)-dependent dehydrogenase (short-subunit alcohol dehydrogenase family)|nr:SDR family oxidoreductase [Tepidisphaeraceae bacterium]